jgi:hypothetical protein
VDVVAAVIAPVQGAVAVQPGDCALHDPAVFAKAGAVGAVAFGDPRCDAALPEGLTVAFAVLGAVGEQRLRPELAIAAGRRPRSTSGSNSVMSLRFAAVNVTARGMPWPSQITWCLEPGRPRSTGEGPVLAPPLWPEHASCPGPPETSQAGQRPAVRPTAPGAGVPTRRLRSSHVAVASTLLLGALSVSCVCWFCGWLVCGVLSFWFWGSR